jgi:hypothetical protein
MEAPVHCFIRKKIKDSRSGCYERLKKPGNQWIFLEMDRIGLVRFLQSKKSSDFDDSKTEMPDFYVLAVHTPDARISSTNYQNVPSK